MDVQQAPELEPPRETRRRFAHRSHVTKAANQVADLATPSIPSSDKAKHYCATSIRSIPSSPIGGRLRPFPFGLWDASQATNVGRLAVTASISRRKRSHHVCTFFADYSRPEKPDCLGPSLVAAQQST